MRSLSCLAISLCFFLCYSAAANETEVLVKSIEYRVLAKGKETPGRIEIPKFQTLDLADLNKDGKVTVDQILFSEDDASVAFVKYGVEPKDTKLIGRLIKDSSENAFIFHGKDDKSRSVAVYFYNFSRVRSSELLRKIQGFDKTRAGNPASYFQAPRHWLPVIWNLFVANANAQNQICEKTGEEALKNGFGLGRVIGTLGACAGGVLRGIWSSTGGLITGIFNGSIWTGMKDAVKGLTNLFTNFRQTLSESYQGILALPIEEQARLFCEVLGILTGNLLVTIMTDGVLALHGGVIAYGRITMLIRGALSGLETKGRWKNDLQKAKCSISNKTLQLDSEPRVTQ